MGASWFQFSHLIFGPFVQGFSIVLIWGCVTNLHQASVLCMYVVSFCVFVYVCPDVRVTLAPCSVRNSSSDHTFKEKRTLGSCRGQQFGLTLRGQVLQVMSAPNWGG